MASEEVKLLKAWFSPFAFRVEWALKLKGVHYEIVEEDLTNKSPLLLQYNPVYKKVPVLVHNGKPIAESLVIIEYIDETWKRNPLLPEDPHQRALTRFWVKFAEDKFMEVVRKALLSEGEQQGQAVEQAMDTLQVLERELKGRKFFGGDAIGLLDIALGCMPVWLGAIEEAASVKIFDPRKYPLIQQWMNNFVEIPAIKEIKVPPKDMLLPCFQRIRQRAMISGA